MKLRAWTTQTSANGWRVTSDGEGQIIATCRCIGCPGRVSRQEDDLGAPLAPCHLQHHGRYGIATFEGYQSLIRELRKRRVRLGLSQEDIGAASGLSDGHINKLESYARIARADTLFIWMETLGLKPSLVPLDKAD